MSATAAHLAWQAIEAGTAACPGQHHGQPGGCWTWGFDGERTAAGIPMFCVRTPNGTWAGEVTRLASGRWAATAVTETRTHGVTWREAEQAEHPSIDAALRWVVGTARV